MTSPSTPHFVGIDVSKDFLDVVAWPSRASCVRFANDSLGVESLRAWLAPLTIHRVVVEATGGYQRVVHAGLLAAGLPVAVVNPRQVRDFAKALGTLQKTDAIDALVLAEFARRMEPPPTAMPSEPAQLLDQLIARRRQVTEMLVAEKNRLKQAVHKRIRTDIQQTIHFLSKQLKDIDSDLDGALQDVPEWSGRVDLLDEIPGVGRTTARTLIVSVPELGRLSAKQIAKLVGLAPLNRDSGQFKGKRVIWGGRAEPRAVLYMATLTATRVNPVIREFYTRLKVAKKSHKVAMVACMHKLLTRMNAMVRTQTAWSCEGVLMAT